MKSESDEIQDDEWLLRRVQKGYFRTNRVPMMSDSAFTPRLLGKSRDPDIHGISLYRKACLSSSMDIVKPENYGIHGVVGVRVSELKNLGLSVRNDPEADEKTDRINGHVVIPELNCHNYLNDKATKDKPIKKALFLLAEITSADDHIFWDPNKHVDSDPSNFE